MVIGDILASHENCETVATLLAESPWIKEIRSSGLTDSCLNILTHELLTTPKTRNRFESVLINYRIEHDLDVNAFTYLDHHKDSLRELLIPACADAVDYAPILHVLRQCTALDTLVVHAAPDRLASVVDACVHLKLRELVVHLPRTEHAVETGWINALARTQAKTLQAFTVIGLGTPQINLVPIARAASVLRHLRVFGLFLARHESVVDPARADEFYQILESFPNLEQLGIGFTEHFLSDEPDPRVPGLCAFLRRHPVHLRVEPSVGGHILSVVEPILARHDRHIWFITPLGEMRDPDLALQRETRRATIDTLALAMPVVGVPELVASMAEEPAESRVADWAGDGLPWPTEPNGEFGNIPDSPPPFDD
jgi:hypothetical protein